MFISRECVLLSYMNCSLGDSMVSCGMESLVEIFIFPSSSVAIVCGELLYDSTLNVVPNASMSRVAVFTMKGFFFVAGYFEVGFAIEKQGSGVALECVGVNQYGFGVNPHLASVWKEYLLCFFSFGDEAFDELFGILGCVEYQPSEKGSQNGKQYGGNGFIDSAAEVGPFSRQKVVSMECF